MKYNINIDTRVQNKKMQTPNQLNNNHTNTHTKTPHRQAICDVQWSLGDVFKVPCVIKQIDIE